MRPVRNLRAIFVKREAVFINLNISRTAFDWTAYMASWTMSKASVLKLTLFVCFVSSIFILVPLENVLIDKINIFVILFSIILSVSANINKPPGVILKNKTGYNFTIGVCLWQSFVKPKLYLEFSKLVPDKGRKGEFKFQHYNILTKYPWYGIFTAQVISEDMALEMAVGVGLAATDCTVSAAFQPLAASVRVASHS